MKAIYPISIMGAGHFSENEESFLDYLKEVHIPDTIKLYKKITTYKFNDYIELDFTSSQEKVAFSKQEIKKLDLLETFEYQVGRRLQEIEDALYSNLNFNKLNNTVTYNEQFSENCFLLLISEIDVLLLRECQVELEYGLKVALKRLPNEPNLSHEFNQYLDNEKKCLRQKNVLLLSYCDAL